METSGEDYRVICASYPRFGKADEVGPRDDVVHAEGRCVVVRGDLFGLPPREHSEQGPAMQLYTDTEVILSYLDLELFQGPAVQHYLTGLVAGNSDAVVLLACERTHVGYGFPQSAGTVSTSRGNVEKGTTPESAIEQVCPSYCLSIEVYTCLLLS
jgi:hypothetical protein